MNKSKDNILSKIRAVKRTEIPLPTIGKFAHPADLKKTFCEAILSNKGEILTEEGFMEIMASADFPKRYSPIEAYRKFNTLELPQDPHALNDLDLAIVQGQFGVAENGAIWFEEEDLIHRVLPFITDHLIVILSLDNLLGNMHAAYERMDNNHSGFGVFIAGPSKTADIEQSLVIGAQGARSLKVVLV